MPPSNSSFKDHFKTLQIDCDAENEVITAAYYALMKKYHPDVSEHDAEIAKKINEAYEVLSDSRLKKAYLDEYRLHRKEHKEPTDITKPASYISQRYQYKEKEDLLKQKEEELSDRELKLKIKSKIFDNLYQFNENADQNNLYLELSGHISEFAVSGKGLEVILQKIKALNQNPAFFVKELLKNKLSMEDEIKILSLFFELNLKEEYPLAENAFRYKALYPDLLKYLQKNKITAYNGKIKALVSTVPFHMAKNSELLLILLDLYQELFSPDEFLEMLYFVQKILTEFILPADIRKKLCLKTLLLIKKHDHTLFFRDFVRFLKKESDPMIQYFVKNL